jgi:hypothetical protein
LRAPIIIPPDRFCRRNAGPALFSPGDSDSVEILTQNHGDAEAYRAHESAHRRDRRWLYEDWPTIASSSSPTFAKRNVVLVNDKRPASVPPNTDAFLQGRLARHPGPRSYQEES